MSYSFVLIEQCDKTGKEVEALLNRRFPSVQLSCISAGFIKNPSLVHEEIIWRNIDVILIDCSVSLALGIEHLQRIKWQTSKALIILLGNSCEIEQVALQKGANESFSLQDSWASLGAKIDALIHLRNHLNAFPFQLDDWSLLEVLHNSENSAVYRAVNQAGKQVAIKRYKYKLSHLKDDFIQQFLSDLQQFSEIKTPRLVEIYDSGMSGNVLYQVMELMPIGSLRDNLKAYPYLPLPHALTWFIEIVYALHIVHNAGLLHRDLKTSNIMLRDDGSLALNDYGTADSLLIKAGFMTAEEISCTPFYVSPERSLDEPYGVTSDIYSLGIIFYELLMGDKPYHGSTEMELMLQHIQAPIPIFPEEYADYQSLLNKMLAKNENLRLQRVIDVASYLGG